jgi:hypothetical protein
LPRLVDATTRAELEHGSTVQAVGVDGEDDAEPKNMVGDCIDMHKLTNDRRKWGMWGLLTGVLVGAVLLDHVWRGPIAFNTIVGRNEYALIDFESTGCFSHSHFRLRYEPTPVPRLLVTDCDPDLQDAKSGRLTRNRRPPDLGVVELTPEQVARLDNLLRFYRKNDQRGGCTTNDTISVVLYQNGFPVRHETFVDSTCESGLLADADPRDLSALKRDDAPALSIWSVIEAAARAKKRGLSIVSYQAPPREQTNAYRAVRERQEAAHEAKRAQKLLKELAGYHALSQEFRVQEVWLGDVNLLPYSLYTTLTAIRPRMVDSAWWFDPVVKGRPQCDWNQFLAVHREVERVVARHAWISAWKKAGRGRTAEAHIFGVIPTEETDLGTSVTPAWRHAGLKGAPRYQILLRREVNTWVELYFGKDDSRALILDASPARDDEITSSGHWLDGMTLFYDPTQEAPDYVVVSPDGTWKRNTRPKGDQGLQSA